MKPQINGREVPPNFKYELDLHLFRSFTWKERLTLALFGMNVLVKVKVLTEHKCGRFTEQFSTIDLTDLTEPPEIPPVAGEVLPEHIQIPIRPWAMHSILLAFLLCGASAAECDIQPLASDCWPGMPAPTNQTYVTKMLATYKEGGYDWRISARFGAYTRGGDYLNASEAWGNSSAVYDTNGVKIVLMSGVWQYNPITIGVECLWQHSAWLKTGASNNLAKFKANCDYLRSVQWTNGAIPIPFDFPSGLFGANMQTSYQPTTLSSNWVSGMAQGLAISAWTRAYRVFDDTNYLESARSSYEFMMTPAAEGGCLGNLEDLHPSLSRFEMIQEYPFSPDAYVLNGSVFAMLGVYDYSEFEPEATCAFRKLLSTIRAILPYFWMDGATTYGLEHVVYGAPNLVAHKFHLNTALVWALDSIRPCDDLKRAWQTWASGLTQPLGNSRLTVVTNGLGSATLGWAAESYAGRIELTPAAELTHLPMVGGDPVDFEATLALPIMNREFRDGGFESWVSSTNLSTWNEMVTGGSVCKSTDAADGLYSAKIISTGPGQTGVRWFGLNSGTWYYVDFQAKGTGKLYVHLSTSRTSVAEFQLTPEWKRYKVLSQMGPNSTSFSISAAQSGVQAWVDNVTIWSVGR